ncbi:MAG: tRNA (guanine(37)-N(1))-methyltransferase [bacterium]
MIFHIITIFPEVFKPYLDTSILGRAQEKNLVGFNLINLRDFATNKHKSVDDVPFGGGAGMVMKVEPIYKAVCEVKDSLFLSDGQHPLQLPLSKGERKKGCDICINGRKATPLLDKEEAGKMSDFRRGGHMCPPENARLGHLSSVAKSKTILLSAKGQKFTQSKARELAQYDNIILICGRYEGVDERVAEHIADEEISIGDYVLTGGELPAMVVADAVTRLIPGAISEDSLREESFGVGAVHEPPEDGEGSRMDLGGSVGAEDFPPLQTDNIPEIKNKKTKIENCKLFVQNGSALNGKIENCLEYPQYTRPAVFKTDEGEEWKVPEILLSGNHEEIRKWREKNQK